MARSRQKRRQRGAKSLFDRQQLVPSQLRTVAQRRLDDARSLLRLQDNARLNGAMYLAGFTVECLLKAELLRANRWLGSAASGANRTGNEKLLWELCYRTHDLAAIAERLPDAVHERLARFDQSAMKPCRQRLGEICGSWTIFARYSPSLATRADATAFLDNVEEVSRCLA